MAENWATFKVDNLFPGEVRSIIEGVTALTGALNDVLGIVKIALEIVKEFAGIAAANPLEVVLRLAVEEIEKFIDGLTQSTAAHAIMIPIQKQHFGRRRRRPVEEIPPNEYTLSADQLNDDRRFATPPSETTIQFIDSSPTATGGNQGFYRALALSLSDTGDYNRPHFHGEFAVAGVCLIFGAEAYKDIQENFDLFHQVFQMGNRANLSGNTRPVAKNVRTRALPLTAAVPARIGVQIDWDPIPPVIGISLYSDEQIVITEIIVVRSIDPSFRENFAWPQAFSRQLHDDRSDLLEEEDNKVIARLVNDGFVTSYVDQDESLTEDTTYFYGVALRYTIDGEVQPIGNFANVTRTLFTRRPQGTRRSKAPDWWATPSVLMLFPQLEGLINTVKLELAGISNRTATNSGSSVIINQTITQINTLILQGEALLKAINNTAGKLAALSSKQLASTSSTTFGVSEGGMDAWMGQLATLLSDKTDTSRPPFDNGELVAGIVIVAGGPNLPALQPFLALMALFFGSSEANPIIDAIDAIETATRDAEILVFDNSMSSTRAATPPEDPAAPQRVFDSAMNPADNIECS